MLIELILNNHFITFKHLFVFLGGIETMAYITFDFYLLHPEPVTCKLVFICGTSFAPFIDYLRSPSSFELDCTCFSSISKGISPDVD